MRPSVRKSAKKKIAALTAVVFSGVGIALAAPPAVPFIPLFEYCRKLSDRDWFASAVDRANAIPDPEIRAFLLEALGQNPSGPTASLDEAKDFGSLHLTALPGTDTVSITGTQDFYGTMGVFVKNSSLSDSQVFARFIAHAYLGRFANLSPYEAGFGLQLERDGSPRLTFRVLDLAKFERPEFRGVAPLAVLNAPGDARRYIIARYATRLSLTPAQLAKLVEISAKVAKRSLLFLVTEEPFVDFAEQQFGILHDRKPERWPNNLHGFRMDQPKYRERHPELTGLRPDGAKAPYAWTLWKKQSEHFGIRGTATAIYSRSPGELLSVELYNEGFRLVRREGEVVVELGRYSITENEVRLLSPKLLLQLAAVIASDPTVGRIVIEADPAHEKLFRPLGFEIAHAFLDAAGKPRDYVLSVTPKQMMKNVAKMNFGPEIMQEWR